MISKTGHECRTLIQTALDYYQLPVSQSAIHLLEMIAAWESGDFRYVRQKHGPALGMMQMEPDTYLCVCSYLQSHPTKAPLLLDELPQQPEHLIFDPFFAVGMARLFFLRFPEPLPDSQQIEQLAHYAKKYWNTNQGKACWTNYHDAWIRHFAMSDE